MRLEEGRSYKFIPLKTIILPDNHENLILSGPDGKKYLLPLVHYINYDITGKKEITCKVDKINCSGRVFLEPEHPYYKEGEYYSFIVDETDAGDADQQDEKKTFKIRDTYGNILPAPLRILDRKPVKGSEVRLKIERISKGRLYFSKPAVRDEAEELTEGEYYDFTITSVETDAEGDKYYVVTDLNHREHRLPVRYYKHYGFNTGDTFRGKIIRFSAGSPKSIEPDNPWYSPGDIVEVRVEACSPDETGVSYIADVTDNNGFSYSVRCATTPATGMLRCRVLKIRKGRPVLIPLDDK